MWKSCISYGQCCVIHKEGYKLLTTFCALLINCGKQKNERLKQEPLITSSIIAKWISSHLIQFWGRSTSKQQRLQNKHCTPTMLEKQKWKWKRTCRVVASAKSDNRMCWTLCSKFCSRHNRQGRPKTGGWEYWCKRACAKKSVLSRRETTRWVGGETV